MPLRRPFGIDEIVNGVMKPEIKKPSSMEYKIFLVLLVLALAALIVYVVYKYNNSDKDKPAVENQPRTAPHQAAAQHRAAAPHAMMSGKYGPELGAEDVAKLMTGAEPFKNGAIVLLYSNGCHFCQAIAPEYLAATQEKGPNTLPMVAVDAAKMPELMAKFDLRGVPSIVHIVGGEKVHEFNGERTKAALLNFLQTMSRGPANSAGPPNVDPASSAGPPKVDPNIGFYGPEMKQGTEASLLESPNGAVVMFYSKNCHHCKSFGPVFGQVSRAMGHGSPPMVAVDAAKMPHLLQKFGIQGVPTVLFIKKGAAPSAFNDDRTAEKLTNFVKTCGTMAANTMPAAPFDDGNGAGIPQSRGYESYQQMQMIEEREDQMKELRAISTAGASHGSNEVSPAEEAALLSGQGRFASGAVVMFYGNNCGHCKTAAPKFQEASHHIRQLEKQRGKKMPEMLVADASKFPNALKKYNITGVPNIVYIKNGNIAQTHRGDRTAESFAKFAEQCA